MMRENKVWFAVEAKSFEITAEGEGKKTKYVITERGRGKVSWIRFGEEGLFNLMKNVDECRNATTPEGRSIVWREHRRIYRLERKENHDGRFLLCSAKDVEGKKHWLVFPEGRGFVNGWALLAEKLRGMSLKKQEEIPLTTIRAVPTKEEEKERNGSTKVKDPVRGLPVDKAWGEEKYRADNAVWVDVGDCGFGKEVEFLQWSLIGTWKTKAESMVEKNLCESMFREAWRLKEGLRVASLNEDLFLLEFGSLVEARRVLESGRRNFRQGMLQLEKWDPYSGCTRRKGGTQVEWVRVVGLPLHLWKTEVLMRIGDACGGYVAMDKGTEMRRELSRARLMVKSKGSLRPSTVNILEGLRSFELQIWWEVSPRVTDVYPVYASGPEKSTGEDDDGEARAVGGVGLDRLSCNDVGQRKQTGQSDAGGQRRAGQAVWNSFEAEQKLKCWGKDQEWRFKGKGGAIGSRDGLGQQVQRVTCGPADGAGSSDGPIWPQPLGPKRGPDWKSFPKDTSGLEKKGQQLGAQKKAYSERGGPDWSGANRYEVVNYSKGQKQKQFQGKPGDPNCGSVISTGQNVIMLSEGETKCEVEGDRPGVKGSPISDALEDPAWICAEGSLLVEHVVRAGLKDCYSFDCCATAGLREMTSELPFFISPSQGFREKEHLCSQALEIVESSIGAEVVEDSRRGTYGYGSRYEAKTPPITSSLCSVFGRPLLSGGPSGLGKCVEDVELGDLAPLRVVTADGLEWGENISKEFSDAILVTENCGDGGKEVAKTREESLGYEKWEDSCLIKFSEFLGIPTVGFDAEILDLLRKMVSQQSGNKRKGNPAESRSERELKKLECTINYNGKDQNRGGRDRGNFLLKLK